MGPLPEKGATGRQLELDIRDDGHGFAMSELSPEHMGLRIMRERAESIGARLDVESRPGYGTCVGVVWPCPDQDLN